MSYTVIVKNKLFKRGTVKFWKIGKPDAGPGDSSGSVVDIGTAATPVSIVSSETLRVQATASLVKSPVFLAIDSASPYEITVEKVKTDPGISWDLVFGNLREKPAALSKAAAAAGNPPVNVTVGQDEPKGKSAILAPLVFTGAAVALYAASVPIYKYSKTLWFVITGVLAASFIGTTIYSLFSKKKGNEVQHDENR